MRRSRRSGKTVEEVWQLIHGAGGGRGPEPQASLASVTLGSFLQSAGLGSLALDLPDVPELQARTAETLESNPSLGSVALDQLRSTGNPEPNHGTS